MENPLLLHSRRPHHPAGGTPHPHGTVEPINEQPGILAHILLSILAYGLLTIAVFQALLLLLQDYRLKHKHPSGLIRNFPPLQTMESLLFGFLWGGWSLLSLSLLSGWLFVDNLFAQHLAHKTILSCFACGLRRAPLGSPPARLAGPQGDPLDPGRFLPVDVGVLRQQAGAGIHPAHLMGLLHG